MNRQLFLQLLEHRDSVSETENIALKKFTEDFPYCQTGQLLFVKYLHSQKSVHYPEYLKIAAAYAADRKVLYHLIHADSSLPATPMPSSGQAGFVPLQRKEEPVLTEIFSEEIPTEGKEQRTKEIIAQVPEIIIPEKKIVKENRNPSDIIQKRLEEISSLKKETVLVPEIEQEKKVEIKSEPIPVKEETLVTQKIIKPEISEKKKEEDQKSGKHSFTEWLKTTKKEPAAKPVEKKKSVQAASSTDEIISRFIETEPRIIPSKAEFYNPIKMAKQSLEEHDDLVSETLAGIFAEQGNLLKAIEMYRKLMLSNPEKSSFFAGLIEKLTQQLNEGK